MAVSSLEKLLACVYSLFLRVNSDTFNLSSEKSHVEEINLCKEKNSLNKLIT